MVGMFTDKRTRQLPVAQPRLVFPNGQVVAGPSSLPLLESVTSFRTERSGSAAAVSSDTIGSLRDQARRDFSQRGAIYDTGHDFKSEKQDMWFSHGSSTVRSDSGHTYSGVLIPTRYPSGAQGFPTAPDWRDWAKTGQTLAQRAAPNNPVGNVATMAGEILSEGLPAVGRLQDSIRMVASGQVLPEKGALDLTANGILAYEFGFKPFANDVMTLAKLAARASQRVNQLDRDSGNIVRRRRYNSPRTSITTQDLGFGQLAALQAIKGFFNPNGIPGSSGGALGRMTLTTTSYQREWFSGGFTYFVDPGATLGGKFARYEQLANLLMGTRVTPQVLYDVTPYSWLVDWFGDFGQTARNISTFQSDGLIMRYGYVMQHTVVEQTYTLSDVYLKDGPSGPFSVSYRLIRKERKKASPFGFGLNPASQWNTRQWQIAGALGYTKADRALRGR